MEMQALTNGVLRKILIQEGESAPLGKPIAIVGEPNEDISGLLKDVAAQAAAKPEPDRAAEPAQSEPPAKAEQSKPAEPRTLTQQAPTPDANGNRSAGTSERLIVSPLAARMAAEAGIDLRTLTGSGPGGRIIKRDIETAMSQPSAYRDEPMSEMRRVIARRLVTSLGPVPHFFLTTEIEMDRAAEMRKNINALDPELKISINDIIIKVAAAALVQHPQVNASFQDKTVRYYQHADIGVAVAIDEGLITPVVRSADQKSLSQIAAEVRELAGRARERKLRPEEYTGASFSISNLGMFGIDEFTAVINPPEGAILAVGAMTPKPVVRDETIVIRQIMRVTMSCDHRVIDGATGAKFLQTFKRILETPLYLVV
jgi:pyruvate dehydrogenase E2 component (dihydrolipoamide acetyltransferase)